MKTVKQEDVEFFRINYFNHLARGKAKLEQVAMQNECVNKLYIQVKITFLHIKYLAHRP